ncbi:MAG: hypothetical protein QM704_05195 [Anaeromyxobacteraceae bacterium]
MRPLACLLLALASLGGALAACGGSSSGSGPKSASGAHVLFLQAEGQVLTPGLDDPSTGTSQLVSGTTTLPAYRAGDAARAAKLQAIVDEVKAVLAPYDVLVTTARPASGGFDLVVLGGASTQAGLPAGVLGAAPVDCSGARPHHVGLVFDAATGHDAARQVVGALGLGHAVPASTDAGDCMCVADAKCTALSQACTIGGPGTTVDVNSGCGLTTVDEGGRFLAAFGAHP